MNRRSFLQNSALAAAGLAARPLGLVARPVGRVAPSDTVNLGIIGPGSRGQYLIRQFLRVPGVRIASLCDIYEPRFDEARQFTGENTPAHDDFRRLLEGATELDGVIVATPLGHHREHVVAALDQGLHVFGEKSLGLTAPDCLAIQSAADRNRGIFQIGLQYRYAGWCQEAVRRIRSGEIGRVTHIYGYWHRNYNWRRPVPDPSLERQINWRLYQELSGGLVAELGSHHIDIANWIFDSAPERAVGSGGITFYQDGRETFDNVQVIYDYPEGRRMFFSSIIGNHRSGFQIQVFGTGGSVELTLEDGAMFYEPARANSAVPESMDHETTPSLETKGDMPYRGHGEPIAVPESLSGDPSLRACTAFIDAVRSGSPPRAGIEIATQAGVAVAMGIEAARTGQPVSAPLAIH